MAYGWMLKGLEFERRYAKEPLNYKQIEVPHDGTLYRIRCAK